MRTLAITDFKAHALQVLGQIAETRESVVVTKRGKPLAEVIPYSPDVPRPGKLADALVFENDILSPLGEDMWDACK
ncbi:MAG: type II toxin-antitoxin system Phd/YefM family antitoxin [Verrucomicrobia bacterium]|jgi:prevent-host-death family protein|nr:type II toxin-antitoxin system Phd/YefM family antitoxin [Verrucomicrobiota bacterium]